MAKIKIRTPAQLRRVASAQIGEEVRGETGSYMTERTKMTGRRRRGLEDLNQLFGQIQPFVSQQRENMAAAQQQAYSQQNQLFEQAASRMDQFRQQRAGEAQALAQQVGGPVPMSAFTEGVDAANVLPHAAAGSLLHALALGQGQTNEMGEFAGRVFPMVQAEEHQKMAGEYDEKISEIEDQITRIKASKAGRTTTRLNELLVQERQDQLERIKADRDWKLGKGSLQVSRGGLDVQRQQLREQVRSSKAGEAIQRSQLTLQEKELATKQLAEGQGVLDTQEDEARTLVDALTSGSTGEVLNVSNTVSVGDFKPGKQPEGAFLLPGRSHIAGSNKQRYYKVVNSREQVGATDPINDPNTIYRELTRRGYDRAMSLMITRQFFELGSGWKPQSGTTNRNKKPPKPAKPKIPHPKGHATYKRSKKYRK
jgi:hypothetical protein